MLLLKFLRSILARQLTWMHFEQSYRPSTSNYFLPFVTSAMNGRSPPCVSVAGHMLHPA
jgi:hypothetical protein